MSKDSKAGWAYKRLDELGLVRRGKSKHRPRDAAFLYGGPYPFIQTGEVKSADLYITTYTQTYSEEGLAQSRLWKSGTLLITIAANIAETAILKFDACFPDSIVGFVADPEKSDVRFIKYYIDTIKIGMRNVSKGTTQDNLSVEKLLTFKFLVPEVSAQRKIADVLSTYDDLIENNTRRIKILEEMAQRLYREWFVHFRFPGHEKVKMVKGVPQGWEVKRLGEVCDLVMGQSPESKFYNDQGEGLPFHQGVTDFGDRFPVDRMYCTAENRVAERGDILFSVRAPVGRINIANKKIIIGRGVSAIRMKTGYEAFLFSQLTEKFQEEDTIGGGTIFKSVTKDDMQRIELLMPDETLIKKFEVAIAPIFREIEVLTLKNANLRRTRDMLLPKLVSGEVGVE